jgi:hypothetical protein
LGHRLVDQYDGVMPAQADEVTRAERRWVMRLPVTLAAVVLGLAIATVALARQQAGDSPKSDQRQGDGQARAGLETIKQLRGRVGHLRAEVETREVEHEAD